MQVIRYLRDLADFVTMLLLGLIADLVSKWLATPPAVPVSKRLLKVVDAPRRRAPR